MKRRKGGRRTPAMMASAGVASYIPFPTSSFVGGCCKMFFPMDETSGTTVTDAIGGAVYTPTTIDFGVSNAIRIATNSQQTLTSGSFPSIGTKDFIFMSVYHQDGSDPVRPEATLRLRASGDGCLATFDGDGMELYNSDGDFVAGTETLCGSSPGDGEDACHAIVRNGVAVGNWLENATWDTNGSLPNDYVEGGELFSRTLRGLNYASTYTNGDVGRNDLNVSQDVIDSYAVDESGSAITTSIEYQSGLGDIAGGMPGVWPASAEIADVPTPDSLQVGLGLAAEIHYYGIALFVFDDGLPSDFKAALRWMKAQWSAGNKVIWPSWLSVA